MRPDLPDSEFNTEVLNDHDLLYGGVEDVVVENRANARGGGPGWSSCIDGARRAMGTSR